MKKSVNWIKWLFKKFKPKEQDNSSPYKDLTPVSNADPDQKYSEALRFALENDQVKNIALTGPYGSGKSSVIKTFESNSDYKFLNISLASFNEEKKVDDALIERSILQQLFYGAESKNLPYSRFKKISFPRGSIDVLIKSALIILWGLCLSFLHQNKELFLYVDYYSIFSGAIILLVAFLVSLPIVIAADIYKSTFGISFKKLSLTNAEIEIGTNSENSMLNKYLEEIIYFFQVTKYDVVVIEDLDRFGSPEIFVKLREINKLINDNDQTNGKIKFLYALKDDMFANADRAKFFDFIVPVVPIINASNSLEKMLERLNSDAFPNDIDKQFLREVALYIYDMRLIHNVLNEFLVYQYKLGSDKLDKTKLLAMMLYKNVYPQDFESLHNKNGALYKICNLRASLITELGTDKKAKIKKFKQDISNSESESAGSVLELMQSFIGKSVALANAPVRGIYVGNQEMRFSQLLEWDAFQKLFDETNISMAVSNTSYSQPQRQTLNKSFKQIESEINDEFSIAERKKFIEDKAGSGRRDLLIKIKSIESELLGISRLPLKELLLETKKSLDEIFLENNINDKELLTYLIKEGYLDETYYLYISNFHEGLITQKDRDFLLTIRNYEQPDPKQQIDTPNEVCETLRQSDFSNKQILNLNLFDYLLENKNQYKLQKHLNDAIHYISENFEETLEFFTAYWEAGRNTELLVEEVSKKWSGYAVEARKTDQASSHLTAILKYVNPEYIANAMNLDGKLTDYLVENGHIIYTSDISSPKDFSTLKLLKVKFKDLSLIKENLELLDYVHTENLYEINIGNIGLLVERYSSANRSDWVSSNYSVLHSTGSDNIRAYINENSEKYVTRVFLKLPENTKENFEYIVELLNNQLISSGLKKQILSKQEYIFSSFDDIPKKFWTHALSEGKIQISWKNIAMFWKFLVDENDISEDEKAERKSTLTDIWGNGNVVASLRNDKASFQLNNMAKEESLPISQFIINNNEIDDSHYQMLTECIPFNFKNFPSGLSRDKHLILARENKVRLSMESFSFSEGDDELLSTLIRKNINTYLAAQDSYPLTDGIQDKLLSCELSNNIKIGIARGVTSNGIEYSQHLADLVSSIVLLPEVEATDFSNDVIKALILQVSNDDDSIRLLTKCIPQLNKMDVINILAELPSPYDDIASFGKRPKIPLTPENTAFANKLKEYGLISKSVNEKHHIRINTFSKPESFNRNKGKQ